MSATFLGNIILKGKLECLTGLHIGGSKDKFEIGGVDSPVMRDPQTNVPYIPGSSLKGKMRSLLSFELEVADIDPPQKKHLKNKENLDKSMPLLRVFGVPAEIFKKEDAIGPTRLIVRDAFPDDETLEMWKNLNTELQYTEYKPENTIDRLTSAANPRFLERVVKGSKFNVEFVFGVYRLENLKDKDEDYFKYFIEALRLLEHSTLGHAGSRGYGQVSFKFAEPFVVTREDYQKGTVTFKDASKSISALEELGMNIDKRLSDFDDEYIQKEIIAKFA
jgi:CRISPR-associated protein Csm3